MKATHESNPAPMFIPNKRDHAKELRDAARILIAYGSGHQAQNVLDAIARIAELEEAANLNS